MVKPALKAEACTSWTINKAFSALRDTFGIFMWWTLVIKGNFWREHHASIMHCTLKDWSNTQSGDINHIHIIPRSSQSMIFILTLLLPTVLVVPIANSISCALIMLRVVSLPGTGLNHISLEQTVLITGKGIQWSPEGPQNYFYVNTEWLVNAMRGHITTKGLDTQSKHMTVKYYRIDSRSFPGTRGMSLVYFA